MQKREGVNVADEIDQAQFALDVMEAAVLRRRMPEGPQATGECLFCGEALAVGRFCDADCRDGFQDENRRR